MSDPRRPRLRPATTWAAIAAALAVHGALLGTVHALDISLLDQGLGSHAKRVPPPEVAELVPTCSGDAFLALTARTAMCAAPWRDDLDDCADDAQMSLWMDLSSCISRNEPLATAVGMLDGKALDRIKQIDPEKLLDSPPEQQPAPPKPQAVPPPLPQNVPPAPPPPPPQKRPMQVVETVKPQKEEAPTNARLLAEYDTKVEHEKVNRGARNEPMVAKAKPEDLTPTTKPPDEDPHVQKEEDRAPGRDTRAPDAPGLLSMRNPGMPHPAEVAQDAKTRGDQGATPGVATNDGLAHHRGDGEIEQEKRDPGELPRGQGGAGGGAPQVPNLQPTKEQLQRALGGGSVDHLEDVDNGDETALSAKRWVYASFFNRLKRQVAQNWDPASVWRRGDPTGQVWGFKTRVTEVRVSLTPSGELTSIVVTTSCGVSDLDDEAVRAFHAAAPFPNPPEGLVSQKDKQITFAFSFFFEIGSPHMSWRRS